MEKGDFKDQSYGLVAGVAKALGNPHRLELLELLASGSKKVEELAVEARMTVGNASQHLQRLKEQRLVKTRRRQTTIFYSLADESVLKLLLALHKTAYNRLTELKHTISAFRSHYGTDTASVRNLPNEDYILLDVRPAPEFRHAHRLGAINIPHYRIDVEMGTLDKEKLIVAYCRGELCTLADEVVQKLNANGFSAVRLEDILMTKSA